MSNDDNYQTMTWNQTENYHIYYHKMNSKKSKTEFFVQDEVQNSLIQSSSFKTEDID